MASFFIRQIAVTGLAVLFSFGASACTKSPVHTDQAAKDEPTVQREPDEVEQEVAAFKEKARSEFTSKHFDQIEAWSADFRTGKRRFDNGSWKIFQLNEAISCGSNASLEEFEHTFALIELWENEYPQSVTAKIAHISTLTSYAWNARTGKWAAEVTEEHWRLFKSRLNEARTVFEASRKLDDKSPMLWRVAQTIALGQGWPREQVLRLTKEAKALEPDFFSYDLAMAVFLMPRWYGKEGEWEAMARASISQDKKTSHETYARIIAELDGYHQNIFKEAKASWPLTKEGFEQLHAHYPRSWNLVNRYALLSWEAGDRETAKRLLKSLDDHVDPEVWDSPSNYLHARAWAFAENRTRPDDHRVTTQ